MREIDLQGNPFSDTDPMSDHTKSTRGNHIVDGLSPNCERRTGGVRLLGEREGSM